MNAKVFFLALIIYCLQLLGKYQVLPLPGWFVFYAGDLVCIPIMLSLALITIRQIKREKTLQLTGWQVIASLIYISIVFELFLPHFSNKFTADWIDVVAYVLGAGIYWLYQQ